MEKKSGDNQSVKFLMQGALLLSIAGFIAKILSAVYRVPFQNMVGNTGFYVYQQVYPIYGIGMTLALSGFPVFFSNLIAEQHGGQKIASIIKRGFLLLSVLALVIFLSLYTFAAQIAFWMGDAQLSPVIQSVSWMFLLMPFLVLVRGYFQGSFRMMPTAISQVVEQLVRVAVILIAAGIFTKVGGDIYQMGGWAMSSATIAALAASLILLYFVRQERALLMEQENSWLTHKESAAYSWRILIRRLIVEGGTICLLSSILVLYQLIDSFTVFNGLLEQGLLADMAKNLKGIYDRGQPLVQLGLVVGVGFSSSYMPLMSRAYSQGNMAEVKQSAKSLLRMTMAFSTTATIGIIAILPRLNHMLFGDMQGNAALSVYVLSIWLASMMLAYHGILQSINQYRITLMGLAIGLLVKLLLNQLFVVDMGTLGASLITVLGLTIMLLFMYGLTPSFVKGSLRPNKFIRKLLFGNFLLFLVVGILNLGLNVAFPNGLSRGMDSLMVFLQVIVGLMTFLVYAVRSDLFTQGEWASIPKGKTIYKRLSKEQ